MLGWLKHPGHNDWANEAVVHDGETLIEATAEDIFARLDFASPKNALRERGFVFGQGNPAYNIFEATDPANPDVTLVFEVTESEPGKRYCFRTVPQGDSALVESESEYTITPQGDGRHLLHLTETSVLEQGLSRNQYVLERATLSFSVFRNLARLKLHIELGVHAAHYD